MSTYFIDARTATSHFPGIGRYTTNLVNALVEVVAADETLRVIIPPLNAQLRQGDTAWSATLPPRANLRTHVIRASPFRLAQQWHVPRLLHQQRPTSPALYHTPYYLMPYWTGLPNVVTLHDLIALALPQSVSVQARWLFKLAAGMAVRVASHVIIDAESVRQELLAHFRIAPERVTAVPLAAAAHFRPPTEATMQAVRAQHNLPDRFIFYFGINKPHKNLVRLLDAYAVVARERAETGQAMPPLVIAGAWDNRYPESKTRVSELGLDEQVRFIGRVSDAELPALYGAATLFVFPSLYEGFGLPVVEAMACGAPVACSDTIGLRDVAGDAALLFDPYDTASIVATLRAALANPDLLTDLRQRGLAQAQRFSWASTAAQTLAIYRELLGRTQG
jgi:alpha-1,3-rhamnosyl/mannosyltransferase